MMKVYAAEHNGKKNNLPEGQTPGSRQLGRIENGRYVSNLTTG